jgi:aminoglycoside phosphotransferase (APT) family kinase protein
VTGSVFDAAGVARLDEWLTATVPDYEPPVQLGLIAGGHSNLTFRVIDGAGHQWVLRRPPFGPLLPTAHDMAREFRILDALRTTAVPVPTTVALCRDPAVMDAPFYLMAMVDGLVARDTETASSAFDVQQRREIGFRLADTLATVHSLDPTAVGLGDLGKPDGYVTRQLRRWKGQLDASRTRPLEELYSVHDHLAARIPADGNRGLVHGDFRLDNCILSPAGEVNAVLDWELCTQGDTMADVGMLMVYWSSPDDPIQPIDHSPTLATGFPTRQEMLDRYAAGRGIELGDVDFYIAFSYWRLACITEGVYARYLNGGMGDRTDEARQFERRVLNLAAEAVRISGA